MSTPEGLLRNLAHSAALAGRGANSSRIGTSAVHRIELPMPATVRTVNVYLFEGDELTLVDTGLKTEATLSALVAGLAQLGYGLADIDRLVITHAHADHFGLAARIVAESGAHVLAHRSTVARIADVAGLVEQMRVFQDRLLRRAEAPKRAWLFLTVGLGAYVACAESLPGDAVGELLEDGHTIDLGGMGWRVLELPGHADGLVCLHQEETGTLISSDLLVPEREYHPLLEPLADAGDGRTRPVSAFLSSLARVEGLHVATILPGHGRSSRNAEDVVASQRAHCAVQRERVLHALSEAMSAFALWQSIHPEDPPVDICQGVLETVSYLDELRDAGTVTLEERKDYDYYSTPQRTGG